MRKRVEGNPQYMSQQESTEVHISRGEIRQHVLGHHIPAYSSKWRPMKTYASNFLFKGAEIRAT